MKKRIIPELKVMFKSLPFWLFVFFLFFFFFTSMFGLGSASYEQGGEISKLVKKLLPAKIPPLNPAEYDRKMNMLANNPPPKPPTTKIVKDPKTGAETTVTIEPKPVINFWPVKTVYPNAGAILPFKRVVAYYGNLYSKKMGVLGEYPEAEMLSKLDAEVDKWNVADPQTPVLPALHNNFGIQFG